jgi:hypothetical protein
MPSDRPPRHQPAHASPADLDGLPTRCPATRLSGSVAAARYAQLLRQVSADRIGASRVGRYVCRHRRAVTRFKRRRIGDLLVLHATAGISGSGGEPSARGPRESCVSEVRGRDSYRQ